MQRNKPELKATGFHTAIALIIYALAGALTATPDGTEVDLSCAVGGFIEGGFDKIAVSRGP